MTFSSNFCKLSPAQQININQFLNQIEEKWSFAQSQFCYGLEINYPEYNLNLMFDNILQSRIGSGGSVNPMKANPDGGFWNYFQKGFSTSAKLLKGPGPFVYDLSSDVQSFIQKNLKYSSNEPKPSSSAVRAMAAAKVKV